MRDDVLHAYPDVDPGQGARRAQRHRHRAVVARRPTPTGCARSASTPTGRRSSSSAGSPGRRGCRCSCAPSPQLPPDVQLVLCAGAPDTPEIVAEVEGLVDELRETRDGVVWIREMLPRADVVALLTAATVFACPSIYEPLGIVNLEAMACETAVVATATGGIPEVVVDGETGLLVPIEQATDGTGTPLDPDHYVADFAAALIAVVSRPGAGRRDGPRRPRSARSTAFSLERDRRAHAVRSTTPSVLSLTRRPRVFSTVVVPPPLPGKRPSAPVLPKPGSLRAPQVSAGRHDVRDVQDVEADGRRRCRPFLGTVAPARAQARSTGPGRSSAPRAGGRGAGDVGHWRSTWCSRGTRLSRATARRSARSAGRVLRRDRHDRREASINATVTATVGHDQPGRAPPGRSNVSSATSPISPARCWAPCAPGSARPRRGSEPRTSPSEAVLGLVVGAAEGAVLPLDPRALLDRGRARDPSGGLGTTRCARTRRWRGSPRRPGRSTRP